MIVKVIKSIKEKIINLITISMTKKQTLNQPIEK